MDSLILKPEEQVRQHLIKLLIEKGYPQSLMIVEKNLKELPHLVGEPSLPNRRIDLICYGKSEDQTFPLMLVECKAFKIDSKTLTQVLGYNHYVKASIIVLASSQGIVIYDLINRTWIYELETYAELLLRAKAF